MYVGDTLKTSFVMVRADWAVKKTQEVLAPLDTSHVIVHRIEGTEEFYYLFDRHLVDAMLAGTPDELVIREALNLHESGSAPTADRNAEAGVVDRPVIVTDDDAVVGFVTPKRRTRGGFRRGEGAGEGTVAEKKLTADFPPEVNLGSVTSLVVELAGPEATGEGLDLELQVGSALDVRVQAKAGFEVEGPTDHRITVAQDDALPVQFRLKATELGRGKIRVLAFMDGLALGAIDLAPTVVPAEAEPSGAAIEREATMVPIEVMPPDLAMVVFETTVNGTPAFEARLTDRTGRLNWKSYGPVELRSEAAGYFDDFFRDIEQMGLATDAEKEDAKRYLAAKGMSLYDEVVPETLREELWNLRGKIATVQIQSEEPWIPWELCKLSWKEHDTIVEGGHLCEEFAVTRWLLEVPRRSSISLQNMALVVPGDSGLPFAADERNFMLGLAGNGRAVNEVAATGADVRSGLASGTFDGWHFSGHGGFANPNPNRSVMVLQSGDQLTPDDLSGVVANLGKAHPLVFLNACQIGRSAMGLTGIGGWASRFLKAGAAAFVGAYWSVYDQAAFEFAHTFYSELVGGKTIAVATQKARQAVKQGGDPTWLAYTVFSEPMASLS